MLITSLRWMSLDDLVRQHGIAGKVHDLAVAAAD
jgi:hypothetical protein